MAGVDCFEALLQDADGRARVRVRHGSQLCQKRAWFRHLQPMKVPIPFMKERIQSMKGQIQSMKGQIQSMKGQIQSMKGQIQSMKGQIQSMKEQM